MRVEHRDTPVAPGAHAARRSLVGDDEPESFVPVSWFWSDQYNRKIQMAGRIGLDDEMHLATGSLSERRFAAIYGRAGPPGRRLGFQPPPPRDALPNAHRIRHLLRRRPSGRVFAPIGGVAATIREPGVRINRFGIDRVVISRQVLGSPRSDSVRKRRSERGEGAAALWIWWNLCFQQRKSYLQWRWTQGPRFWSQ